MMAKRFLFITGCGRSGTTAFARLMNLHPDIVLGVERFKGLVKKERFAEYRPELFSQERFFAFSPDETNAVPENREELRLHYDLARTKFGDAAVVGDKAPSLLGYLEPLKERFPDARVMIIVRDVAGVANSWKRLGTSTSRFFAGKNARHGVKSWNQALERTAEALRSGEPPFIVRYDALFSGRYDFGPMLNYVGVPHRDEFQALYPAIVEESAQLAEQECVLDDADRAYIAESANFALYREILERAR